MNLGYFYKFHYIEFVHLIKIIIMKSKFLIYILLLISSNAFAQSEKGEWEYLFNGKDLNNWKILGGKATYSIQNGEIIGTTVSNTPNTFLSTEKEYDDFILEVELLVHPLMNSGIQIRSLSKKDYQNGRVHGYQVEVDPSSRAWSGGIYDEARRGWLYNLELHPQAKTAFKNNEWNKYRIECIGNSIRTWLNGIPVAHLIDAETQKGFIALQVHSIPNSEPAGRQIRWKNIRIQTKNLKPSPPSSIFVVNTLPNNLSKEEKSLGYRLLWAGKTNKGWTQANKNVFPEKGWNIQDGVLSVEKDQVGQPALGGDITTKKKYTSFELKFDFKLTEGANSGIKYFVNDYNGFLLGLEYQILDDEKHPDAKMGIKGNRTLASLYDIIAAQKIPASLKKNGEWNQAMIRVYPNNNVEHWLNGYKVLEFDCSSKEFKEMLSQSKFKEVKGFGFAPNGKILIQDHGDEVSFRSLKIRELQ
jgi:hypothetical protein